MTLDFMFLDQFYNFQLTPNYTQSLFESHRHCQWHILMDSYHIYYEAQLPTRLASHSVMVCASVIIFYSTDVMAVKVQGSSEKGLY